VTRSNNNHHPHHNEHTHTHTHSSATSIEWLIYLLIKHPEVQKKAHEELDRVVGSKKLPTYEDIKERLPYINAIVLELFRFKHFAPFGIPHHTTKDTTLGGYNIPKNTQIMFNFHALHSDPRWWKTPEKFRPERFLEEDKYLNKSFINAESKPTLEHFKYLPFGHGKRMCVGFGLGRVVMLMKTAMHLHCFRFTAEDGSNNVDIDTENFGVTLVPKEQKVRAIPRPAAKLCKTIEGDESICRNL
jgi:cytochrome P450